MQQYFNCPVILKRGEDNFDMVMFLKASWCDGQNINPCREVGIWQRPRRYGQLCLYLEVPSKAMEAHERIVSRLSLLSKNTP